MIVDTSAIVAILRREPEADDLIAKLLGAEEVQISAGTLLELRMVANRERGGAELEEILTIANIEVVPVDERQIAIVYGGFLRFGRGRGRAGLNFGDLFAYALARMLDEPLLYKGDDFPHTDVESA